MVAAKPQPFAIVGPTAAGKSDVALAVAAQLPGQTTVLACDSVQLYRGFDLGSGKPRPAERAAVPHLLLDLLAWDQGFDAAQWSAAAERALQSLHAAGHWALICGGTGLYLRALCNGLVQLPEADPGAALQLRQKLQSRWESDREGIFAELQRRDPATAARLHVNSRVHVLRSLEICLRSGMPASEARAAQRAQAPRRALPTFYLDWPRDVLRQRILRRSEAMLQEGLLQEVAALLHAVVDPGCRPMCSVGYRACAAYLQAGVDDLPALTARIFADTWAYARRQRTWWRRESGLVGISMHSCAQAAEAICAHLTELPE